MPRKKMFKSNFVDQRTVCEKCGFETYLSLMNTPDERKKHKKRCDYISSKRQAFGGYLPLQEEREQIKREAHSALAHASNWQELIHAQHQLIWAHFARSFFMYCEEQGGRRHPRLADYTRRYPRQLIKEELRPYFDVTYGKSKHTLDMTKSCVYQGER